MYLILLCVHELINLNRQNLGPEAKSYEHEIALVCFFVYERHLDIGTSVFPNIDFWSFNFMHLFFLDKHKNIFSTNKSQDYLHTKKRSIEPP